MSMVYLNAVLAARDKGIDNEDVKSLEESFKAKGLNIDNPKDVLEFKAHYKRSMKSINRIKALIKMIGGK